MVKAPVTLIAGAKAAEPEAPPPQASPEVPKGDVGKNRQGGSGPPHVWHAAPGKATESAWKGKGFQKPAKGKQEKKQSWVTKGAPDAAVRKGAGQGKGKPKFKKGKKGQGKSK